MRHDVEMTTRSKPAASKRGPGRPPVTGQTLGDPFTIRLTHPIRDAIERVMEQRKDGSDRSQIIRELLSDALIAQGEM